MNINNEHLPFCTLRLSLNAFRARFSIQEVYKIVFYYFLRLGYPTPGATTPQ